MSFDQKFRTIRERVGHPAPAPFPASFAPAVVADKMLVLSGEGPRWGREIKYKGVVWEELSVDQAKHAAEITTLNLLWHAQQKLGSLDRIAQMVEVLGFVRAKPSFASHPAVLDSCSNLLLEVFGEDCGEHARCALGVSSLPLQICIEIRMSMLVKHR